uniref:Uncharacterized protein n=1 Tax=Rhodnius prolixus TaxID=13249 RepID=T1HKL5_RHOPR
MERVVVGIGSDHRNVRNISTILEAQRSLLQKLSETKELISFDFTKFFEFVKKHYPECDDIIIKLVWSRLKECSNSISSNKIKANDTWNDNSVELIILSSDDEDSTVVSSFDEIDLKKSCVTSPAPKFKFSQFTELKSKYSMCRIENKRSHNALVIGASKIKLSREKKVLRNNGSNGEIKKTEKKYDKIEEKTSKNKTKLKEESKLKRSIRLEQKLSTDSPDHRTTKKKRDIKSDASSYSISKKDGIEIAKEKNANKKIKPFQKKSLTQTDI